MKVDNYLLEDVPLNLLSQVNKYIEDNNVPKKKIKYLKFSFKDDVLYEIKDTINSSKLKISHKQDERNRLGS